MVQVRTLVVAVMAATVAVVTIAPPAAAATTCTYNTDTRRVTVTVAQDGTALLYVLGGRIHGGNGDQCGRATTVNTNSVRVVGTMAGSESLAIDMYNGRFAPGAADEGDTLDEIEITVDLKGTTREFTRESLTISGRSVRDTMTLGTRGISLNRDGDVDVTFTGDMSYAGKLDVTLAGWHGSDRISAQGGYGSGSAVSGYYRLTIYGNTASDTYSDSSNELRGGNGPDFIIAGNFTRNVIYGHGGDDVIFGANDIDALYGMRGDDQVNGDNGNDRILGGPGDDRLTGGADADVLYGQDGQDDLDLGGDAYYVGDPAAPNQDLGDCGAGDLDEVLIDVAFDQTVGCETTRNY